MAELRAEDEEIEPAILLVVRDDQGAVVRRLVGERKKGLHRLSWDLRWPTSTPVELEEKKDRAPWDEPPRGPLALPGEYTVTLAREVDGVLTELAGPEHFRVIPLALATLPAPDRDAAFAFQLKVARLQRAVAGAVKVAGEAETRLRYVRKALVETPQADPALMAETQRLTTELLDILVDLRGDPTKKARNVFTPPSIRQRVERVAGDQWFTTSAPTQTHRDGYRWAGEAFTLALGRLRGLFADLESLEAKLEAAGGPWTPGRLPSWVME